MRKNIIAFFLPLATSAVAQENLLGNPGFENGALTVAPWIIVGTPINPTVEMHAMPRLSPSYAYRVGVQNGATSFLRQDVDVVAGQTYEVSFRATRSGTGPVTVSTVVDGTVMTTDIGGRAAFWTAKSASRVTFLIEFRPSQSQTTDRTVWVDYVRMIAVPTPREPALAPVGTWLAPGSSENLLATGHAGVAVSFFISAALVDTPVQIPGFTGEVQIDLSGALLLQQGVFSPTGILWLPINVPTGIGHHVLWIQAVQLNVLLRVADLGSATRLELLR